MFFKEKSLKTKMSSDIAQERLLTVIRGQFHVLDDLLAITKCHDCGECYHKLILQRIKMAKKDPSMRGMFLCRSCSTKRCDIMFMSQVDDQKYDTPPSNPNTPPPSENSSISSFQLFGENDILEEIDITHLAGWSIFD